MEQPYREGQKHGSSRKGAAEIKKLMGGEREGGSLGFCVRVC